MESPSSPPAAAPRSRRSRVASLSRLAPFGAALVVLGLAWLGRGYTADDAFIPGRYALRVVAGDGYTFRDGPPTDGVTGPALLAIEIGAARLGLDPVDTSKGIGALAVALAAFLVVRRVRARASGALGSMVSVIAFACSGALAMHAQSGLETGLATCVLTLAGLGATTRSRAGWALDARVIAALLLVPWLRPELVPVTWALATVDARRRSREASAPAIALAVTAAAIGLGSVVAFRLATFGSAIPLSAQAKPTDLGNGLGYALVSLATLFGLSLVPALNAARTSRDDGALLLALVVAVVTVILGGGDWMPGARLLVPIAPLVISLSSIGLARFARSRPRGWVVIVAGIALFLPQAALTALSIQQADEVAFSRAHAGHDLRSLLDREARVVALVDVGFLAYRARWEPFDLAGVTDPAIGTRAGEHCAKEVTLDDLLARDVDTVVLHSGTPPRVTNGVIVGMRGHPVEQALASDPRMRELYVVVGVVRWAPGYHYVILRRRR